MYPHPPKGVPFNGNPFRNPLESPGYKSSCAPSALSRASRRIITFGNFQRSPPETSTKWASFINDSIYIGVTWLTPVTHENSRHFFGGWFFSTTITPFLTIVRALILYVYISSRTLQFGAKSFIFSGKWVEITNGHPFKNVLFQV